MSYNEERMIAEAEAIEDYMSYPEELCDDDADTYDRWRDNCTECLMDDMTTIKKLLKHHLTKQGYYKGRFDKVKEALDETFQELVKEGGIKSPTESI